jgi:hypothetical protein
MPRGLIGAFISAMGGAAALGRAVATDQPISWLSLLGVVLLALAAVRLLLALDASRGPR